MSSTEKNRRRMLCAGDVANAGVASCAAGAEFGWYLATCVINTLNFISANHSKLLTQQDDDTKFRSRDTSFYSIQPRYLLFLTDFNGSDEQAMCYDINECNINNLQETEHAYQTQNHQTTKPSHPQDINTTGHPNIKKFNTLLHNWIRP